ncbi:MAG TPA: hypothetical protein VIO61_06340 [Anaerolineaceae bacterium]
MSPHKMYQHNCSARSGEAVLLPQRTCRRCKQKGTVSWQSSTYERMAQYRRATGLPSIGPATRFIPDQLTTNCKTCGGSGYLEIDDDEPHACPECDGTGLRLTRPAEEIAVIRRWVSAAKARLENPAKRIILPPAVGALLEASLSGRKPPAPTGGRLVLIRPEGDSASAAQAIMNWVNEVTREAEIQNQVSAVLLRCEPAVCDLFHEMAYAWSEAELELRVKDGKILLGLPGRNMPPESPGAALLALEPGAPARIILAWDILRDRVIPQWLVDDFQVKVREAAPDLEEGNWAALPLTPPPTLKQAQALLEAALHLVNQAQGNPDLLFSP